MSNKENLFKTWLDVAGKRSVIQHIAPFTRSKADSEAMLNYLDKSMKSSLEDIDSPDSSDRLKDYKKNQLKKQIIQASKHRSKIVTAESRDKNKILKNFLSSKKTRISSLKADQAIIDAHIKTAKDEYNLLKKNGGSRQQLRKVASKIAEYKTRKEFDTTSKLRGYGISGQEARVQSLTNRLDILRKNNASSASIDKAARALDLANDKHNNILSKGGRGDFTARNIKGMVAGVLSNPRTAGPILGNLLKVGVRAIPVAGWALLGYEVYSNFVAPMLFNSEGNLKYSAPTKQFRGMNQQTRKTETVAMQPNHGTPWYDLGGQIDKLILSGERAIYGTSSSAQLKEHVANSMVGDKIVNKLTGKTTYKGLSPEQAKYATNAFAAQGLDPALAYAIANQESNLGKANLKNINTNGTYDSGIYQMNDIRIKSLMKDKTFIKKYGQFKDIDDFRNRLVNDRTFDTDATLRYLKMNNITTSKDILAGYNSKDPKGTMKKVVALNKMHDAVGEGPALVAGFSTKDGSAIIGEGNTQLTDITTKQKADFVSNRQHNALINEMTKKSNIGNMEKVLANTNAKIAANDANTAKAIAQQNASAEKINNTVNVPITETPSKTTKNLEHITGKGLM